jgi:hypothetical protein
MLRRRPRAATWRGHRSRGAEQNEMWEDLAEHEEKIFSQCGEDGVLRRIFETIGSGDRYFVEFGAWDGCHLSNTANLRINHGWSGLLMEGSDRADGELVQQEFVSAENVSALFAKYGVPETYDLLSIDIDGNDYWVWKAIEGYRARVVVVEYNIFFELDESRTMRYDPRHVWDETQNHGASLAALRKLGSALGYTLVHTDSWAPNAFFVHDSELPAGYRARSIEALCPWKNGIASLRDISDNAWVGV